MDRTDAVLELLEPPHDLPLVRGGLGVLVGWQIGGTPVAIAVGLTVYVVAALHPKNITTCPFCGEGVNPRATRCRSCTSDLV